MIEIKINEAEVEQLYREKISELIKEADKEHVFWDAKELRRKTCMSCDFIQEQFSLINAFLDTK